MVSESTFSDQPLRVVFVCRANIARSPLAAAMLRALVSAPGLWVGSAGVSAREGYPAAREAMELAAARGLDLSDHRSVRVSGELLRDSDLVLAMTEDQRDECASQVPGAGPRTFTLREFVRLLGEIPDGANPSTTTARVRWVRDQAHAARPRASRPARPEDLVDPTGRPPQAWEEMGRDLDELIGRIRRAVDPSGG